jgi:hypothetical protein
MSESARVPTPPRDELIALLAERATVLAPSEELINRALRRCVRHDLRAKSRASTRSHPRPEGEPAGEGGADVPLTATPSASPALEPDGGEGNVEGDGPLEPIATAVAKAHTLAEDPPETHPPSPAPVAAAGAAGALGAVSQAPSAPPSESGRQARILATGTPLGGYRIESLIGVGGMGQVYRATQVSMGRQVALKVLLPRYTKNPRFRERFLREARAAGRLHHPNLIAVHDVGEADGLLFFSMELVEGTSIKQLIAELGVIAEDRALDIARQTLEALRYAHERGIIHRDIKPDNLMLTATGTVKVADLGLSRSDNDDDSGDQFTTQTGTMMGTPYYMPPEQGRDAHRADLRADLYAVGATLYHMVCGKVPFDGDSAVAILIAASTQPLVFPEPGPTAALRRFLDKLMAKKPLERPQSASDALAMIRTLHSGPFSVGGDVHTPKAAPAARAPAISGRMVGRARRRRRMRRASVGLGVVGALLVVAAGAWWELENGPRRELRRSVAELDASHRYPAALGQIDLARERRPRDGALCDALRAEVIAAWDAWAAEQAAPVLAEVDAALAGNRFNDADGALNRIQEAWRSPAMLDQLDRRERALEDARNRLQPLEERRAGMQKLVDAWVRQLFAGKGQFGNGRVVVTGRGSVVLAPPQLRNRAANLPLELAVRAPVGGDRVVATLAPGIELRFAADGASLVRGGASQMVARADDQGRSVVVLHRRGGETEVVAADGAPGSGVRMPGELAPTLSWDLAAGHQAEIAIAVPTGFMRKLLEQRDGRMPE